MTPANKPLGPTAETAAGQPAMSFDSVPEAFRDQAWYTKGSDYAFLVDAPITLGHSQLRVTIAKAQQEEDVFRCAAPHIANCISVLRKKLSALPLHNWETLAHYTRTSGTYIKTLVLKVSADESPAEYKVHLVPYFSSHLEATGRLHCAVQGIEPGKQGGLLHWIGRREVDVDRDIRYGPDGEVVKRNPRESFNLRALALHLRENASNASPAPVAP